jgi:hypothetical protein
MRCPICKKHYDNDYLLEHLAKDHTIEELAVKRCENISKWDLASTIIRMFVE